MNYRGPALVVAVLALSIAGWAVTPQFWEDFSQADLLGGSLDHVSLGPDGRLLLAPSYELAFDTQQPYIFSMVGDRAGNLYVGTGDDGKVFRINPQGKGELFFQSKELEVFAMAVDSSGALYVGTSPDGKIYKATGPNQASEFANPESRYIWSMTFDDAGNLYAGTGSGGAIYKVDRSGKASVFYTCADTHVVSLFRDRDGRLLAGTSPSGMIIEITREGKGFTLVDTPMEEVQSIATDRFGTVYALAASSLAKGASAFSLKSAATPSPSATPSATVTVESFSSETGASKDAKTVTAPGGADSPDSPDSTNLRSAVYAIAKDGSVETVYSSEEQMAYDLVVRQDGSILVATGPKGRLLSVDTAKQVTVVSDAPEEDLTCLFAASGVVWVGGSNQGRVYQLRTDRAPKGSFESSALDAGAVASWGRISWRAASSGGAMEIATRSGNTEKPDASWSEWSAPYSASGQQIASPRARRLQWRAIFSRGSGPGTPVLDGVQIAYLQQNLRPHVTSVEVLPYGVELQKQPSLAMGSLSLAVSSTKDGKSLNAPRERGRELQPLPPRQVLQPGAQSFTWKAADDNNDTLEYSLYFKGEAESDWKLLVKGLSDEFYTLGAASLPDGAYRLKVVASDAPDNPYDRFLIGEMISDSFVIVNTSPKLEVLEHKVNGGRVEVHFQAAVSTGRIGTAEFSVDGGEWRLVFPVDGIADSDREEFRFVTPELAVGEHLLGIRAGDRDGNTAASRLVVKVAGK